MSEAKDVVEEFYARRKIHLTSADWFVGWVELSEDAEPVDSKGFHKFKAKCQVCFGTGQTQEGEIGKTGSIQQSSPCCICEGRGYNIYPQYCKKCELPKFYNSDDSCDYCRILEQTRSEPMDFEFPDDFSDKVMARIEKLKNQN